jgi:hypothetical protein
MTFKIYAPLQMYFASILLKKQLINLGHKAEIVSKLVANDESAIWIIYNASMAWAMPKHYICYQTEQIGTHWFNTRYYQRLANALAVWEYNEANLPCYQHLNSNISIVGTGIDLQPKVNKDIDFLFYGGLSERRKKALQEMPNVKVVTNVLGADMQKLLARTKTVLNIHYYDNSPLETFRINECLSHHCNIISEYSSNGDEDYKDIVTFTSLDKMKEKLAITSVPKLNLSKFDNLQQIKDAVSKLENIDLSKKTLTLIQNNNMIKLSKYELKKGLSSVTFRPNAGAAPVTINNNNITDSLVELAIKAGKGHCFVSLLDDKKKEFQKNFQSQPVTSTLTERQIEKDVLNEVQKIKEEHLSEAVIQQEKPKRGRPAKSKE